jgi:hypothetical protein
MDENYLKKERRRQARLERLGTNTPRCVVCNEDDPSCLELHHIPGRKFGDELVIVCRNCHRKLGDAQKDHPCPEADPPSVVECIVHFLQGLADLFEQLVPQLRKSAKQLLAIPTGARDSGEGKP